MKSQKCDPMVHRPINFTSIDKDALYCSMNNLDVSNYEDDNDVNNFTQNISNVA